MSDNLIWIKIELDKLASWVSSLLEALESKDGVACVRQELMAVLKAAIRKDGCGDSFLDAEILSTIDYMRSDYRCKAKGRRTRGQKEQLDKRDKQVPLTLQVGGIGQTKLGTGEASDGKFIPLNDEFWQFVRERGLDEAWAMEWLTWHKNGAALPESWKGSLTGFCRMKEGQWKKQGNQ